ncbi:DUF4190 domain-containing protein [Micromonospora coxensis]|uniref:DUF4190 domain-containing protein n=1 Tax=Micromonospora coxensis TaxID=356852 RepID=UPI0034224248
MLTSPCSRCLLCASSSSHSYVGRGLPCLLAVVLGHVGLHETRDGRRFGRGMAVAGLVLGYVFVAPMVLFTIMVFFGGVVGAATPTSTP